VTYVDANNVVIPTHSTTLEETSKPIGKDEVVVTAADEKAESRPEDEKGSILLNSISVENSFG
jgi:hypothetical protein